MNPYLEPQVEFFDRASVPPQIQELLDQWPEIDPGTARLVHARDICANPMQPGLEDGQPAEAAAGHHDRSADGVRLIVQV